MKRVIKYTKRNRLIAVTERGMIGYVKMKGVPVGFKKGEQKRFIKQTVRRFYYSSDYELVGANSDYEKWSKLEDWEQPKFLDKIIDYIPERIQVPMSLPMTMGMVSIENFNNLPQLTNQELNVLFNAKKIFEYHVRKKLNLFPTEEITKNHIDLHIEQLNAITHESN